MLVVSFDGYCAPNPGGRATWAFLVSADGAEIARGSGIAAESQGTSAIAEWRAAYEALAWLHARAGGLAAGEVAILNDNMGVVRVLSGGARVPREPVTRKLAQECRRFSADLERAGCVLAFSRVPRWENAAADALALEAFRAVGGRRTVTRAPPLDGEDPGTLPEG